MKEVLNAWWEMPEVPWSFTSLAFWGFLFVLLLVQSGLERRPLLRNLFLFAVSLWFYRQTSGWFVTLLVAITFLGYRMGKGIDGAEGWRRRAWLGVSVGVSLVFLLFFKYAYFFADSLHALTGLWLQPRNPFAIATNQVVGSHFDIDKIGLPIGISFYTFQTISYAVDVYRKEVEPVKRWIDFGFYVSFFPQLVAGPIVRAKDFIPQLHRPSVVSRLTFGMALFWIINGLLKKIWLGDGLALMLVDRVFANPGSHTSIENLWALYGYSLQVYADFSGYTDIATGIALLFGFRLPANFNSPYKARHLGDFWRRWHMSLSGWLRDYLYIPMGGNRAGSVFTFVSLAFVVGFCVLLWPEPGLWLILAGVGFLWAAAGVQIRSLGRQTVTTINLMLTMLIGGLWHGASWNFVLWGGLNGAGLVVSKQWRRLNPLKGRAPWLGILLTFHFVTFTRIWFRSSSATKWDELGQSHNLLSEWFTANEMLDALRRRVDWEVVPDLVQAYAPALTLMSLGYLIHMLPSRLKRRYRLAFAQAPHWVQWLLCILAGGVIWERMASGAAPFIYFQF